MKKKERETKKAALRDLKPKKAEKVKGGASLKPYSPPNG